MRRPFSLCCCAIASLALAAPAVRADTVLLARTTIDGTATDLSGLTAPLENGVAGNALGGFGSGLAYAGSNTFVAVPDRGPNAVPFNPLVDDTVSWINRTETFRMSLTPSTGATPLALTPTLVATTLLSSPTPLTYGTGALGTGTSGGQS